MSANACSTPLYIEPMHPMVWGTLAPECECCKVGRAVALCWFAPWFCFLACPSCAAVIASSQLLEQGLRRAFT